MTKRGMAVAESAFDMAYLATVFAAGAWMLAHVGAHAAVSAAGAGAFAGAPEAAVAARFLFGLMALVLGCGDALHLLPRVYYSLSGKGFESDAARRALGFGKLAASITMAAFYVLLWRVFAVLMEYTLWVMFGGASPGEPDIHWPFALNTGSLEGAAPMYVLFAARVLLCLAPQNRWFDKDPPRAWAIARNAPFVVMGAMVAAGFFIAGFALESAAFLGIAALVVVGFACYIPVVLFAHRNPRLGMLMLPKSVAYAAIVLIGLSL